MNKKLILTQLQNTHQQQQKINVNIVLSTKFNIIFYSIAQKLMF